MKAQDRHRLRPWSRRSGRAGRQTPARCVFIPPEATQHHPKAHAQPRDYFCDLLHFRNATESRARVSIASPAVEPSAVRNAHTSGVRAMFLSTFVVPCVGLRPAPLRDPPRLELLLGIIYHPYSANKIVELRDCFSARRIIVIKQFPKPMKFIAQAKRNLL